MQRFMMGRYGNDRLNTWLLGAALVSIVLSYFTTSYLIFVGYFLWGLSIYRMLSKQTMKRYNENLAFIQYLKPLDRQKNLMQRRALDKYNAYYLCPSCKQMVRVPKGQGKITITCPKCRKQFKKRS